MRSIFRSRAPLAFGAAAALLLFAAPALQAQQTGTITGRVSATRTGEPLASVQIYIAGLDIGVLTQNNGRYLLQNVPTGSQTVTAERIGYRTVTQDVTVTAGGTVVQNFDLSEEALQLDEVIVTGTPGGTQKRALGNSVTAVDVGAVTQDVAVPSMQNLLTGRATGLQFVRQAGNVGAGSPIQIRGVGSFNLNSNPLIYVDGVRVNNSSRAGPSIGTSAGVDAGDTGGGGEVNVLDDFNPQDIQSIEIIKGPAAATIYGTEASAGVIQIITKKGAEGAPRFNVSIREGANYIRNPAGRLGQQYTCASSAAPPCADGNDLVPYNMYDEANRYINEGYFPWPTSNLYQNGLTQNYNLDVRGGTSNVHYFISGNYTNDEGAVWYNAQNAYRLRGNLGLVFSENVSLDVSTGYVTGHTRFAAPTTSDGGTWQDMRWSNGHFLDRITPFDAPGGDPRLGGFQEHLPSDVAKVSATRDYSRFTGSAQLHVNIGDWLTQRLTFGLDKGWDTDISLFPLNPGVVPANLAQYTDKWDAAYSETAHGEITYTRPVTTNVTLDYSATADYDVTSSLSTATSGGFQYYSKTSDRFSNHGIGFPSPLSTTVNQTPPSRATIDYSLIENKSVGFYVQEELSWQDRLFLTGAVRFDDNSAFGANFSATKYPKISGAWVVSEESFWNVDWINSLRLRSAWGMSGRQPDAFAGRNIYSVIPGPGGTSAIEPSSPGNRDVGPEKNKELEVGFDIALLDDRISGEFTYFNQHNEDALLQVPIEPSIGFPGSRDQNLGRLDNWGWEASVDSRLYESPGFSFDLRLSGDHTDNKIKSLGTFGGTTSIRIGYPYPNETLTHTVQEAQFDPNGYYSNAKGEKISAMCDVGRSLAPDGAENPSQYGNVQSGELAPCETLSATNLLLGRAFYDYTFSITPTISLMNNDLQLYAMAEGKYGKWGEANDVQWGIIYNNSRVTRTEDDPLWVARDRQASFYGDNRSKGIFDASFWKLREVGLRYRLPESLVGRAGVENASITLSGRELWTIWTAQKQIGDLNITDPEYGTPTTTGASNFWEMPPLSSISATLRVSF